MSAIKKTAANQWKLCRIFCMNHNRNCTQFPTTKLTDSGSSYVRVSLSAGEVPSVYHSLNPQRSIQVFINERKTNNQANKIEKKTTFPKQSSIDLQEISIQNPVNKFSYITRRHCFIVDRIEINLKVGYSSFNLHLGHFRYRNQFLFNNWSGYLLFKFRSTPPSYSHDDSTDLDIDC